MNVAVKIYKLMFMFETNCEYLSKQIMDAYNTAEMSPVKRPCITKLQTE